MPELGFVYETCEFWTEGEVPVVDRHYPAAIRSAFPTRLSNAIKQAAKWATERIAMLGDQQVSPTTESETPEPFSTSAPVSEDLKKKIQDRGIMSEEDLTDILGKQTVHWYKKAK